MARQIQIIKGTTEQNEAFTGAEGALTYDTETKNLRIHDGTTEGGFEIPSSAMGDYVIYWDSADSTDHSHAKPGVSTPTDHGWYRYYKSGWVEQGGTLSAQQTVTATLPIEMSDNNYQVLLTAGPYATTAVDIRVRYVQTRTTTSFTASSFSKIAYMWQVTGMSAQ